MKILWFSPTPSLAEDYLNDKPTSGGWIKSLEKEMEDKVDLSIVFYGNSKFVNVQKIKTKYYPILFNKKKDFFTKIRARIFNELEPETDLVKFEQIIEDVKPDLIHIHGSENPFGLIQTFTSIPTVISIQGIISVAELKFFSGISYLNVLKYSRLKNLMFLTTYLNDFKRFTKRSKREKIIFKISKNFIGRTNWDRRVTKVLSPDARYFYNNEILKEDFYEGEWNNKLENPLRLFTTSGSDLYKGIETIIYCANLLDSNNIQFSWEIAGINSNDEIVRIAQKRIKKKLSPNIRFLGKVNDEKLKASILKCHIYICSSHIENSPNSLCEALILGAPCIATNAGGIPTFIENGKSGLLVQDGDPYSLCGAIIELRENYNLAIDFGNRARTESLIRHDKKIIASDLLNIYHSILNKSEN